MNARWTSRACVAIVLFALASGACESARTFTAPTPPGSSPPPALHITFSVTGSIEGTTYVYNPTLTVSVPGDEALTVTGARVALEGAYDGQGAFPKLDVHHRIPAGATLQLFRNPRVFFESDLGADRMWVEVSYVDDAGRTGTVQATTTVSR